jgi:sulfopyruvate decarboxylase TPP-binding subunit
MSEILRGAMVQARLVLEELKRQGVTHVIGLPDNSSARLFDLLSGEEEIRLVSVTREGEAFAVAAGLWIGGRTPVVLVQNTGFCESGDGFRGTVTRMRAPLVILITYRGYAKLAGASQFSPEGMWDAETLSRPQLDSAALVTEPTLKAWGLAYDFLHTEEDLPKLADAFRKAAAGQQPHGILITGDLT